MTHRQSIPFLQLVFSLVWWHPIRQPIWHPGQQLQRINVQICRLLLSSNRQNSRSQASQTWSSESHQSLQQRQFGIRSLWVRGDKNYLKIGCRSNKLYIVYSSIKCITYHWQVIVFSPNSDASLTVCSTCTRAGPSTLGLNIHEQGPHVLWDATWKTGLNWTIPEFTKDRL